MPSVPAYTKPPVSEALIDIRIDPLPVTQVAVLDSLHEKLSSDYPTKKPQKQWEGTWEFREDVIAATQKAHGITGYLFESKDKKRIIQYRLDGFTCNFLKPDPHEAWPGWESLRDEAKRTWDIYAEAFKVQMITRIAVRYINRIVIPAPVVELSDYLTAPPDVPKDFDYQTLISFLSRVTVAVPDLNARATITQAPAREPSSEVVLLLDIDIDRNQRVPFHSRPLWQTLDRFREIKNSIFEKSLKSRAKELFNE